PCHLHRPSVSTLHLPTTFQQPPDNLNTRHPFVHPFIQPNKPRPHGNHRSDIDTPAHRRRSTTTCSTLGKEQALQTA
ncbi:hypothetical protein BDQ17DRAFT_1362882, partial [Cyathus striatus]